MGNSTPLAKIHDSPTQESQEIHWDDRGDRTESHLRRINSNINWITFLKSLWNWKSTNKNKGGERYEALTVHFFPLSLTGESEQHMRHISVVMKGCSNWKFWVFFLFVFPKALTLPSEAETTGAKCSSLSLFPEALFLTSSFLADSDLQAVYPIWISLFPNKAPQGLSGSD